MNQPPLNSWDEYRRLVIAELERLNGEIASLRAEIKAAVEAGQAAREHFIDRRATDLEGVREYCRQLVADLRRTELAPLIAIVDDLRREVTAINAKAVVLGTIAALAVAGAIQAAVAFIRR